MGKRQIGEMEPFELVITLIIADLATIPMAEQSIPIWYGIIPLLVICVVHFGASVLTKRCPFMRDILNGKPVIVIDDSGIAFKELKKLNISCEELMEALRNLEYFDLSEINYAIIERNGKITVIPKAANMPTTREDQKIRVPETDMFYCIVENGKVLKKNFTEMGLLPIGVISQILHHMRCKVKNVQFCTLCESGDVYAQKNGEKAQSFKIDITPKDYTNEKRAEERRSAKGEL
jgi:uncharacterized membrane protein YcaP (DUF421 family)